MNPATQIISGVVGIIFTFLLSKLVISIGQYFRRKAQEKEILLGKSDAQADNQKANKDSDALKSIDGRE